MVHITVSKGHKCNNCLQNCPDRVRHICLEVQLINGANGAVWLGTSCIGASVVVHGNLDRPLISSVSWTAWLLAVLVEVACLSTFEGDCHSASTRPDLLHRNVPFSVSMTKERGCWMRPCIFPRRSWSLIHTESPFAKSGSSFAWCCWLKLCVWLDL